MKRFAILLATSFLFAGSFIAAKYATIELEPLSTAFLRYFIAVIFLTILILHFKTDKLRISKKDIPKFVITGLTGIAGYHFFFFVALRHTQITNTAIINALSPIVTGVMAAIFIRERLSRGGYIGMLISVFGVLVLLSKGHLSNLIEMKFASLIKQLK